MFINADGGLTTAGYVLCVILGILALGFGAYVAGKRLQKKKMTPRQLAFCSIAIALAFVTSYITLFKLPNGGAVTLMSMLFISLVGYWYGLGTGLLVGLAYGILEFIQEPYFLSFLQVCFDYLFAFAALGLSGIFCNKKNGLVKGYIVSVLGRAVFATLAGYFFWYDTSPEGWAKQWAWFYPIAYNFSYLLVEGAITVVIISLPPVKKALEQVTKLARK